MNDDGILRTFDSGATRDTEQDKLDFEGFLNPQVLTAFAEYMHEHRMQTDGNLRDGDNWQKGFPDDVLMKSLYRHFIALHIEHRRALECTLRPDLEAYRQALGGCLFNIQALWLNFIREGHEEYDYQRHNAPAPSSPVRRSRAGSDAPPANCLPVGITADGTPAPSGWYHTLVKLVWLRLDRQRLS